MLITSKKGIQIIVFSLLLTMTVWLLPAGEALQADAAASIDNPKKAADGTGIWSCINFGYYYQAGRGSKNPIKWRVLQVNGNDAFLVSDKLLDARQFNDTKSASFSSKCWENSSIRSWLNGYGSEINAAEIDYSSSKKNFLDVAFSLDEQRAILKKQIITPENPEYGTDGGNITQDKLFLLSYDEVTNSSYGFSANLDRTANATAYAKDQTASVQSFWLRTTGFTADRTAVVKSNGMPDLTGTLSSYGGEAYFVRPALHLDLSSDCWEYAGTVAANPEEPVKTPAEDYSEYSNTQRPFTMPDDSWQFKNPQDPISLQRYGTFFDPTMAASLLEMDQGTGGQCFGMATAGNAINAWETPAVKTFDSAEHYTKLHDVNYEDQGVLDDEQLWAKEYIKLAYIYQYTPQANDALAMNYKTLRSNLNAVFYAVRDYVDGRSKEPILLTIYGSNGNGGQSGHAVLVYGFGQINDEICELKVYDPNVPEDYRTLTLTRDESGNYASWEYPIEPDDPNVLWGTGREFEDINYLKTPANDFLKLCRAKDVLAAYDDYALLLFDFKVSVIIDENGEEKVIVDSDREHTTVKNRLTPIRPVRTDEDSSQTCGFWAHNLGPVKVTDIGQTIDFQMMYRNRGAKVTAPAGSTVACDLKKSGTDTVSFDLTSAESGDPAAVSYVEENEQGQLETIRIENAADTSRVTMGRTDDYVTVSGTDKVEISTDVNGKDKKTQTAELSSDQTYGIITDSSEEISVCSIIEPESVVLSNASYTYSGTAKTPAVTVKDGETILTQGNDYTLQYKNNVNAGTASVIIKGTGRYTGTVTKSFTIKKASQAVSSIKSCTKTYGNPAFSLKAGAKTGLTYRSGNTSVASVNSKGTVSIKSPGKAVITVNAAGNSNYLPASRSITVTVNPKRASISKVSAKNPGTLKVYWKRDSKASGYQVSVARDKKFKKGRKTCTITKNKSTSKTFKKLSRKKYYYIRVRAYKNWGSARLYGSYSKVKKVRVR